MLLLNQCAHHYNCDKSLPRFEDFGEKDALGAFVYLPMAEPLLGVMGAVVVAGQVVAKKVVAVQLHYCSRPNYGQANKRTDLA